MPAIKQTVKNPFDNKTTHSFSSFEKGSEVSEDDFKHSGAGKMQALYESGNLAKPTQEQIEAGGGELSILEEWEALIEEAKRTYKLYEEALEAYMEKKEKYAYLEEMLVEVTDPVERTEIEESLQALGELLHELNQKVEDATVIAKAADNAATEFATIHNLP